MMSAKFSGFWTPSPCPHLVPPQCERHTYIAPATYIKTNHVDHPNNTFLLPSLNPGPQP